MDFRHLHSFIAVAEELSFRRAAERLHLSQPPLSRQIQALEEELGVQLLERDRRSAISLTDAGRVFLQDARLTLAAIDGAGKRAQEAARGRRGRLIIADISGLSARVLPGLLGAFRERSPEVEVSLVEMTRPEQLAALREGRIHAGIFPDLGAPLDRRFQSRPLFSCPMAAVLPAGHALARGAKREISIHKLAGETLLIPEPKASPGYVERLQQLSALTKFTPAATQSVKGLANLLSLVAAGYGVCILPEVVLSSSDPTYRIRRLRAPVPEFHLKLLWLRKNPSRVLRNFLAVVEH